MPAEAPAMPAQAQARNSLYAYSQAAASGVTPEPAPTLKTSTAVAESMAAETLAVGTSQVTLAPEAPEVSETIAAEPAPQGDTFVEIMEAPVADSFIAPLPAAPELTLEPEIRAPARVRADPFATAALENGSRAPRNAEPAVVKAPESRKGPGFFAKMTGGASRAIQAATQAGEQRSARAPATAQGPAQTAATPRAGAEPRLGGIHGARRRTLGRRAALVGVRIGASGIGQSGRRGPARHSGLPAPAGELGERPPRRFPASEKTT
jgi:cell division protein FtsZ